MTKLIRAAGGLLWRETARGLEILVIHRERYDDWSLPKGKLKKGERWEDAALREVVEETRLSVELGEFAGVTFYEVADRPKVVLFWNMALCQGTPAFAEAPDTPDEVDQIAWLTPEEAVVRLNYSSEGALVMCEADRFRGNIDTGVGE